MLSETLIYLCVCLSMKLYRKYSLFLLFSSVEILLLHLLFQRKLSAAISTVTVSV